jgi:CBS domain-containing protein
MRDENIGAVVVAEEGVPLGIVTDRDLVVRVIAAGEEAHALTVGAVMSGEPIFLGDARNLDQVIATMRDQGIRRMPIVDDDGQLEGIISLDDLVVLLGEQISGLAEVVRKELEPPI